MNKTKITGNEPAYPMTFQASPGLTIRQYFAAMAMQGILSNHYNDDYTADHKTEAAVMYADSLIEKLNK